MAVSGGLHEPISFFAILLTLALLFALPAALAYVGLTAPSPERVEPQVYSMATLPARVAIVVVVVLPLALVAGSVAVLLLGTLFHAGSVLFGRRSWEGSVSVWLYTAGGMLAPVVAWLTVTFAAALAGYLLGLAWPDTREGATDVVRWAVYISGGLAGALALDILLTGTLVGCAQAFRQDAVTGAASGLTGLAALVLVPGACLWVFAHKGMPAGLACTALLVLATAILALGGARKARQALKPAAATDAAGARPEGGE
jgi:hypothetical protein